MIARPEPAPLEHLRALERDYGRDVWRTLESTIAHGRSQGLRWPEHILAPMGAAHGLAMDAHGDMMRASADCGRIAALSAWRTTKGIYRYDPELRAALEETPLDRELPGDVLLRMPEWCVYIELDGEVQGVRGAYVHHEVDAGTGRYELRVLLDLGTGALVPVPLHIGRPGAWRTVADAVALARDEAIARAALSLGGGAASDLARSAGSDVLGDIDRVVERVIALTLYLCTDEPDILDGDDERRPTRPRGRPVGAQRVTTWSVGWRLGAALRRARERAESEPQGGTHAAPVGHVRRAHWHTYWLGSEQRGDRRRDLRWLAPILVGLELGDDLAAVVRRVT